VTCTECFVIHEIRLQDVISEFRINTESND